MALLNLLPLSAAERTLVGLAVGSTQPRMTHCRQSERRVTLPRCQKQGAPHEQTLCTWGLCDRVDFQCSHPEQWPVARKISEGPTGWHLDLRVQHRHTRGWQCHSATEPARCCHLYCRRPLSFHHCTLRCAEVCIRRLCTSLRGGGHGNCVRCGCLHWNIHTGRKHQDDPRQHRGEFVSQLGWSTKSAPDRDIDHRR